MNKTIKVQYDDTKRKKTQKLHIDINRIYKKVVFTMGV
jgi:hypothetical protein